MIAAKGVEAWHRVARHMTSEALDEVLAEDVVFQSPIVHTPQKGREITKLYLMAAANVLPGDADDKSGARSEAGSEDKVEATAKGDLGAGNFGYVREVIGERDAVLEFVTVVDGITVNGVDMIRWNDEGKIIDFKVMVRPLKAVQKLHAQMAAMLESMKKA